MLKRLSITNLALIQNIEIELFDGFSVFTGETGAGKSVLMGAIGLLLGHRAASEHIRSGENSAEVQGLFTFVAIPEGIKEILQANEIPSDDGTLIIRRIIRRSGRNRILINQIETPLATLKSIGERLIDLHGQHDHQTLLREEAAIEILDTFKEVKPLRFAYNKAWVDYSAARKELANHNKKVAELAEKKEFLQFQYDEIAALGLKENEEEELEKEYAYLSSVTQRGEAATTITGILDGDSNSAALSDMIGQLQQGLDELTKYDDSFGDWKRDVKESAQVFNELRSVVSSYSRSISDEANPLRLDDINSRLSKIQRLKKKYSCDFDGIVAKAKELEYELDQIFNGAADAGELEKAVESARLKLSAAGETLEKARKATAQKFDAEITDRMASLGFQGAGFRTDFEELQSPNENGYTFPHFMVRTNKGEPFMDLTKTASGGEISRIMLAIKVSLAGNDPVPILVFDEIDTGVGGKRAAGIASTMVELAEHHQLFVISHLQQIASKGSNHYSVYKHEVSDRTITEIKLLSESERIEEIARMLGGDSDVAIEHARDILN